MLLVAHRTPATSSARLLTTDGRSQHAAVDLPAVLVGIWHEAHAYRAAIHRSLSTARCDLRVSASGSGQDGTGLLAEPSAAELLSDRARFALATQELSAVAGRFTSQGKPSDGTTPRGDKMYSHEGRRA